MRPHAVPRSLARSCTLLLVAATCAAALPGRVAAATPSVRDAHVAIYDPVRDRMIVFGGWDGHTNFRDTWALSLSGTPAWTPLSPGGATPPRRRYSSAIYDPVRDRMIVFGGFTGDLYVNDVWALSLGDSMAWTELTPEGPPPFPRYRHSAIYDPVHDRMIVYGGWFSGTTFGDVWALSLGDTMAWTDVTPAGPAPEARFSHGAIFDPVRDRMVVYGGIHDSFYDDTWALSLGDTLAWAPLTPAGPVPRARFDHTSVYDPVEDRLIVFGGWDGAYWRNDAWSLPLADPAAWTPLDPAGTTPAGRYVHSAIVDPVRARMLVFGGSHNGLFLDDVAALSLSGPPEWSAPVPPDSFTLVVNAAHGTVSETPAPVDGKYTAGTAVLLTATPDAGYAFLDYTGDVATATDTVTVIMTGDETVTADFVLVAGVGGTPAPGLALLGPAQPNPFHGAASLSYSVAHAGPVSLVVYGVHGEHVRTLVDGSREPGVYRAAWDGRDDGGRAAAPGVYYARLETAGQVRTRALAYLR